MTQPYKDAVSLCKTIMRNGYDAYVINPPLQQSLISAEGEPELDIATDIDLDELTRLFPVIVGSSEPGLVGSLTQGGATFRFHAADVFDASHPDLTVAHITPRMIKSREARSLACPYIPKAAEMYEGFTEVMEGEIRFKGLADDTLKHNYLWGIRALRFAANYELPVEANTWMAIVRASQMILDYVSVSDIMDEWRKVEAENLWRFVELLHDSQLLHGLVPELAALSRVSQIKNESGVEETVFAHTLEVMRRFPEELSFDWFGTMACLFHDVGKLFTAEYYDSKWHFHQHHRVGAKVTRRILNRLRFLPGDTDLICHLVRNHMRFSFMLTDKGIRRFKSLDEYPRLIEMSRADIKARDGNYTAFNHNMKFLERADTPEEMLEPLLNGNEIMDFTGLHPGPVVGIIRDALLKAQVAGEVTSVPGAVDFVRRYQEKEQF